MHIKHPEKLSDADWCEEVQNLHYRHAATALLSLVCQAVGAAASTRLRPRALAR